MGNPAKCDAQVPDFRHGTPNHAKWRTFVVASGSRTLNVGKMTWREFELNCEELVRRCLRGTEYTVRSQVERSYADGQTKRLDIHIVENRQGGRHFVIDCKHFPIAVLNENEIKTTIDYRRRSRASKALILVSDTSNCPDRFVKSAERQNVPVLVVPKRTPKSLVGRLSAFLNDMSFNRRLRRGLFS